MLDSLQQSAPRSVTAASVLRLLVGSFLNWVIQRAPRMLGRGWWQSAALSPGGAAPTGAWADGLRAGGWRVVRHREEEELRVAPRGDVAHEAHVGAERGEPGMHCGSDPPGADDGGSHGVPLRRGWSPRRER